MTRARHEFPYCPRCRTELDRKREGGLARPICGRCGYIQYLNPAPGAGVVLTQEDRVCLVRRKFEPKRGEWSLPTGFMEWDEDVRETARRETLEETGLEVELQHVFAVESGILPPDIPVLVVFYRAEIVGGELCAGDDAEEVGFFCLDSLPQPVAFAAHRKVLEQLRREMEASGELPAEAKPMEPDHGN